MRVLAATDVCVAALPLAAGTPQFKVAAVRALEPLLRSLATLERLRSTDADADAHEGSPSSQRLVLLLLFPQTEAVPGKWNPLSDGSSAFDDESARELTGALEEAWGAVVSEAGPSRLTFSQVVHIAYDSLPPLEADRQADFGVIGEG